MSGYKTVVASEVKVVSQSVAKEGADVRKKGRVPNDTAKFIQSKHTKRGPESAGARDRVAWEGRRSRRRTGTDGGRGQQSRRCASEGTIHADASITPGAVEWPSLICSLFVKTAGALVCACALRSILNRNNSKTYVFPSTRSVICFHIIIYIYIYIGLVCRQHGVW